MTENGKQILTKFGKGLEEKNRKIERGTNRNKWIEAEEGRRGEKKTLGQTERLRQGEKYEQFVRMMGTK